MCLLCDIERRFTDSEVIFCCCVKFSEFELHAQIILSDSVYKNNVHYLLAYHSVYLVDLLGYTFFMFLVMHFTGHPSNISK